MTRGAWRKLLAAGAILMCSGCPGSSEPPPPVETSGSAKSTWPAERTVQVAPGVLYTLQNAERAKAEQPDDFELPPVKDRQNLEVGSLAKLMFRIQTQGDDQVERMWVLVKERDGERYLGQLDSDALAASELQTGSQVEFSPRHVVQIDPGQGVIPQDAVEPSGAERPRSEALRLNDEAVQVFGAGDPSAALLLFRRACGLAPEDGTIRANTARCLIALGDRHLDAKRYEDAVSDYHEAGGLDTGSPAAAVREAVVRYRQLRDREALGILVLVVRDFPDDAQARDLLGRVLYRLGENARAIEEWEHALRLRPEDTKLAERLERARKDEAIEKDLYLDLTAAHFAIKYDGARDQAVGQQVSRVLEAAYQSVGALLGRYPRTEISVVVYPGKTFRATTGAHGWVAGLYDGKIRVPAQGLEKARADEVRRVLTHEYAHALLRAVGGPRVPTWLHEGFAQIAEGRTRAEARTHLRQDTAPSVDQLGSQFSSKADVLVVRRLYAGACDLVHALLAQGGAPGLAEVHDRLGRGESLDAALKVVYGQTLQELHASWKASLPN